MKNAAVSEHRAAGERTAQTLRRLFDEGFSRPTATSQEATEDLILIRVCADSYALRLTCVSSLHVGLAVTAIPGAEAPSLGIAGLRGALVAVYDLAHLLGYPPATTPRWHALVCAPSPVSFAFESLEMHCRVGRSALVEDAHVEPASAGRLIRGAVRAAGGLHPLIHIDSLLTQIREGS